VFPRAWKNAQDSLARRLFLADFLVPVTRKDPQLKDDIKRSYGSFYRFANECYLYLVNEFSGQVLDEHMPKRFINNREYIREMNNPLVQFLNDATQIQAGPYVREKEFLDRFRDYCKDRQFGRQTMSRPFIEDALKQRGCRVIMESKEWPINSNIFIASRFFVGIQIVPDQELEGE